MRFESRWKECGQGIMEYVIVAALITVAAIGIYSAFGKTVRNQTAGLADSAAGKPADTTRAREAANSAAGRANDPQKQGMAQYNYDNDGK